MYCDSNLLYTFPCFVSPFTVDHRDLHSFPPRRSSDLCGALGAFRGLPMTKVTLCSRSPRRTSILTGVSGRMRLNTLDRKSTRLNSSHRCISYAVFCLKKKKLNANCLSIRDITLTSCNE